MSESLLEHFKKYPIADGDSQDKDASLLQHFQDNPIGYEKSVVDQVIEKGDDPDFPIVPEDKFKHPKQLSMITKLRKEGWDDKRIFDSMEIWESSDPQFGVAQKEIKKPKKEEPKTGDFFTSDTNWSFTGEGQRIQVRPKEGMEKDDMWDRLSKPTKGFFLAGGLKKTAGSALMTLGTTVPAKAKKTTSRRAGYSIHHPEVTREEALEQTFNNPLFQYGSAMFADGLEQWSKRPDLQPSDNIYDYNWNDAEFIASSIGNAIPSFLTFVVPSVATLAATRNPVAATAVAMSTAYGMETGSMMETALEYGISPIDAANVATTVGTINAMISAIPAGTLFSKMGIGKKAINDIFVHKIISKQLFKDVGTKTFTQGVAEIVEEVLQESVNIEAETNALGIEMTEEEKTKRLQSVIWGAGAMGGTTGSVAGVQQTGTRIEKTKQQAIKEAVEILTVENTANSINDDVANDFNIEYDKDNDGSTELSQDEIIATGYDIDLNKLPSRKDENGNTIYQVKVKGENDSQGNIRLNSQADRSTLLEELTEARLRRLQNSKNKEDQQLVAKIENWMESVRKRASEMGLNLRFSEEGEGNIELFSDAIVYTVGGHTGLSKEFQDATYIPKALADEFLAKLGQMSDGTQIFDLVKSEKGGVTAKQDFASAVDRDFASQLELEKEKNRPPPPKPPIKTKLQKKSFQMVPDENTKTPEFKKWFGDSKVVDENNQPLVVYHGTVSDFDRFDINRAKKKQPGNRMFGDGFYFSEVLATPNLLSRNQGGNIIPVYLSIKNPWDVNRNKPNWKPETIEKFLDLVGRNETQDYIEEKLNAFNKGRENVIQQFFGPDGMKEILIENGYDGIKDGPNYIAFEPTQIKSAFNRGTFDPNDTNISYQLEPDVIKKAVETYPDVLADEKKESRLGKYLKRLKTTVTKANPVSKPIPRNKQVGVPKNKKAVRVELQDGSVIYVGAEKTAEQWLEQVNSILTIEEQEKASMWYEEAYPTFVEHFGEDQAIPNMVAWLMGNVNASPAQALSNMFLGIEQLNASLASHKSAGLPGAAKNVKKIMRGERTEEGAGAKLYDFLDSALGKTTRTIMQDNEKAGSAVAFDRHTNRDTGFVDSTLKNKLMELAVNPSSIKGMKVDNVGSYKDVKDKNGNQVWVRYNEKQPDGTIKKRRRKKKDFSVPGPTETQYEWGVSKFNKLSKDLNASGYMGGDLNTWQHQAIGWTAIARALGTSDGMSIPDSFRNQTPTIAFELQFGEDTPYAMKYGKEFSKLPKKEQIKVTKDIINDVVPELAEELGLKIIHTRFEGLGGWEKIKEGQKDGKIGVNANAVMEVQGSTQAINALMNSLGILFQQDSIGSVRFLNDYEGLGMYYTHPDLAYYENQETVYRIIRDETDNSFAPGFFYDTLTDANFNLQDEPAVVISTFLNKSDLENYTNQLETIVERIRNEVGITLTLNQVGSKYEGTSNNWKKNPTGREYRDKLIESHGKSLPKRLDDYYGKTISSRLENAFGKDSEKRGKSYQLEPDYDYAAQVAARQKVLENTDLNLSEENTSNYLYRKIVNELGPVLSWQKDVEDQFLGDNRLRQEHDVVLAAELYVGKVPELLRAFNRKMVDVDNKESFVSRLTNSGVTIEDFSEYLHALHAKERNDHIAAIREDMPDKGSGMSTKVAEETKARLNKKYGLKALNKWKKEFRKEVIDKALDIRLEAGLITQEDYDRMNEKYKNYIPLFREMDNKEGVIDSVIGGAKSFDVKGKEFKKAKGSERKVQNTVMNALVQYESAVIRAEKNLVNKRLLALVEAYPSESYEISGIKHRPEYDEDGEINYMVPIVRNRTDEEYIHVKVDGKVKQITFKGKQGMLIANAMKNVGSSNAIKWLYPIHNYLRYVNTMANPSFVVTNFIRDIQAAGIAISAEQGNEILTQALSPKALGQAWKGVYQLTKNEDANTEWARLYDKLRLAGGKTGFFNYQDIEDRLSELEKNLERVDSKGIGVKSAGKSLFNFIENANEATESAVRLTLFKAMLDNGYSEEKAAMAAKNVTVNFNRKGEWGQLINSGYLFANASIQGTARVFGLVKNSKKARVAMAGLATVGFTEAILNNMASEDDDEYEKLNDFEKDNYFIMRYGTNRDDYFKFRLPYGFNVFKVAGNVAGEIAWAAMKNEKPQYDKHAARMLNAMASSFSPFGTGPLLQTFSPTVMDPLVQISTNKNFYGGPIWPEDFPGRKTANVTKSWDRTPKVYKDASELWFKLNDGTIRYNDDGTIAGAIRGPNQGWVGDVSPEVIEHFVTFLGGGLGSTIGRSINTVRGAVGYDSEFHKAPFVRQFYGKFGKDSERRIINEYQKNMHRYVFDSYDVARYESQIKLWLAKHENDARKRQEIKDIRKRFMKAQKKAKIDLKFGKHQENK